MLIMFSAAACGSTATFLPIYFIPLFFQFTRSASALSAGVHLLPFVAVLVVFCVANGGIMSATGYYMPWFLFGAILTVIGDALLYTTSGATISLAIANAVFLNGSTKGISAVLPQESIKNIQGAVAGASSAFFESLDEQTRDSVVNVIVDNMKKVYILGMTAGALLAVLSIFMKREKLFMKPGAA